MHIIETKQFDLELLHAFFKKVEDIDTALSQRDYAKLDYYRSRHSKRTLLNLFYEASTRTRLSFDQAARLLGISVSTTENAREFSSAAKGETLEDTIRVLCGYAYDVIVLRHHEKGAAERAVSTINEWGFSTSIINAGDGAGQHPTQALLDLYTIQKERKEIDGVTIVFGGDLKYGRTVRSLAYLLGKFKNITMYFVAPEEVQIQGDILEHLTEQGVKHIRIKNPHQALPEADVVYWTRLQKERMPTGLYEELERAGTYHLGSTELALMREKAIIMHPLPRVNEIAPSVDHDSRAAYFRQAHNGLPVRMALLDHLLTAK